MRAASSGRSRATLLASLRLIALASICCVAPGVAAAAQTRSTRPRASAPAPEHGVGAGRPTTAAAGPPTASRGRPTAPAAGLPTPSGGRSTAPSGPPLDTDGGGESAEEEASSAGGASAGDPLASNGLNSPLCRDGAAAELSASAARDCAVSGLEAASDPTGDYAFDVHINTGIDFDNDAAATIQDLAQLAWTALVAAVHGLIVMLDWCFTLDLLGSSVMGSVGRGLRATQATFTQPWLVLVLALASMLATYNGLVRRRVAETLGEALLMLAMMAGGLWVIMDPLGTVGALSDWANEASLGTLAAVAAGNPAHSARTLSESTQSLFANAINGPWCYMEFGEVSWCADPARLDPRLRAAALRIASEGTDAPGPSASLLRAARTNGELFLALPANQIARNSIRTGGSLFNVLCGGEEEPCHGPTAKQAEFRTQNGTAPRLVGLFLIWAGALGMLLALGFVTVHLLGAALTSLLYLLLTPIAVLAPALGEGGRAAFQKWGLRLLGAVTSKLLYSCLLGAMLAVEHVLLSIRLGWWTQWLLVSVMWWCAFGQRHQALSLAHGRAGGPRLSLARRMGKALDTPRSAWERASGVRNKLRTPAPDAEQRRKLALAGRERARSRADEQVGRSLEQELAGARSQVGDGAGTQKRLTAMRSRLARIQDARTGAVAAGDTRRTASLDARAARIGAEIERDQDALARAARTVADSERAQRTTGEPHTREQREQQALFLDAQAALPAGGRARRSPSGESVEGRDYAALASLAGHSRARYEQLDARAKRAARVDIDRELALRKELGPAAKDLESADAKGSLGRRDRQRLDRRFDQALGERMRASGHRRPSGGRDAPAGLAELDAWKREGAAARARPKPGESRSPVLDDAREVAARRKRQLGRDNS